MAQLSEYTEITQVLNEQNRNTEVTNKILIQVTGFLKEQLGFLRKEEYEALNTKKAKDSVTQVQALKTSDFKIGGSYVTGIVAAIGAFALGMVAGIIDSVQKLFGIAGKSYTSLLRVMIGKRLYGGLVTSIQNLYIYGILYFEELIKKIKGIKEFKTFGTIQKLALGVIKLMLTPIRWFLDLGRALKSSMFGNLGDGGQIIKETFKKIIAPISNTIKSGGAIVKATLAPLKFMFALGKLFGRFVPFLYPLILAFDGISGAIKMFKNKFDKNGGFVNNLLEGTFLILTGAFSGIVGGFADAIAGLLSWVANKIGLQGTAKFLRELNLTEKLMDIFGGVKELITKIFDFDNPEYWSDIWSAFKKTFGGLFNIAMTPIDSIVTLIKDLFNIKNAEGEVTPFNFTEWLKALYNGTVAYIKAFVDPRIGSVDAFNKAYNETLGKPYEVSGISRNDGLFTTLDTMKEQVKDDPRVAGFIDGSISNSGNTNNNTAINYDGTPYDSNSFRDRSAIQDKWRAAYQ